MKKIFLTMALAVGLMATAQVKIGNAPTAIDANSLLELETTNQGLLFPRVALESTTSYAPLLLDNLAMPPIVRQKGMTVYNTATTSTGTNDVTEGLYTNDGTNWVKVGGATPKTLYTDNAAITSARTVTLNNNDLTFTAGVGGTGKTVVASSFKTSGGVYGKGRTVAVTLLSTDWTATDYAIIITATSIGQTVNLPDASLTENVGRIVFVSNAGTSGLNFGGTDDKFKPVTDTALTAGRSVQCMSIDGKWYLVAGIKG
jgi:hypothetical protein